MFRLIYNIGLPVGFLFFLPGLLYKYRNRGGWKNTFGERFGHFGTRKEELKKMRGAIWIHAVSVGETIVALQLIRNYQKQHPERQFILSTTTTTGQDVARERCPGNTAVIFCPLDFPWMVSRALNLLKPSMVVIFETEIWPNFISMAHNRGIPLALVNGRMSDHSAAGYRRARFFFSPLLQIFDRIMVQSEADAKRYLSVSPLAHVSVCGNMKFDQAVPAGLTAMALEPYFGSGTFLVLLGASTHPGEEERICESFEALRPDFPNLRLVLVPRHAERGGDIAEMLTQRGLSFVRRSCSDHAEKAVDVLLGDTTGEMLSYMKASDLVIMGKSFAGQDEGHNLIEPALLAKPIVTGPVLRNFREILRILLEQQGLVTATDSELTEKLHTLLADPELRETLGRNAEGALARHRGASQRTIDELEKLLSR